MKELDLDKLAHGTSTHIRLFSGDVKNFNLHHIQDEFDQDLYFFGFTMKTLSYPRITIPMGEDNAECAVLLDKKGIESLITFLNKLCKDEK